MSNMADHARREFDILARTACGERDVAMEDSIVKAIEAFMEYGHSGGSASWAIPVLNKLLKGENIAPLTDDASEWNNVGPNVWQNARRSDAFSEDGGATHYLLEDSTVVYVTRKAS